MEQETSTVRTQYPIIANLLKGEPPNPAIRPMTDKWYKVVMVNSLVNQGIARLLAG